MQIEKHEKIIKNYNEKRSELLQWVIDKITQLGSWRAAKYLQKNPTYISALMHRRKYSSYEQLLDIAKKIKEKK